MKVNGRSINGPTEEVVVIPRRDGDLVFKAAPVLSYEDLDKLDPRPNPPIKVYPGGKQVENPEDSGYKTKLSEWSTRRYNYMVLKSLSATEGLEFDTVDLSKPETWGGWRQEMQDAGFSNLEIARIEAIVIDACGLNQIKIDEATKRFLAGPGQGQENASSQNTEQSTTPSGDPVSAST